MLKQTGTCRKKDSIWYQLSAIK